MEELKFKGTPGPWYVSETGDVVDSSNEDIAQVWPPVEGDEDANARLIAAAPDMLEALQDLVNMWTSPDKSIGEMYYCIENAQRIIKKALEE